MKQGKSLQELTAELDRQNNVKRDFIIDTCHLEVLISIADGDIRLQIPVDNPTPFRLFDKESFIIQSNTHNQLAQRLRIPQRYYDLMKKESPDLLVNNINHWFQSKPDRRMIRTLDNKARAYLSDRYRRLDNYDLAQAVLPVLQDADTTIRIESTEVTERRLYIKAIFPQIEGEIKVPNKVGDVVQAGIVISNSEIGQGSLKIEPLLFRQVNLNGITTSTTLNRYSIGRAIDNAENGAMEIYSDATVEADNRAFYKKVQDIVRARSLNDTQFNITIEKVQIAAGRILEAAPEVIVERTASRFGLAIDEKRDILTHLIQENDMSAWGLTNAITRASQDVESYDRATEMERIGGRVIEMAQTNEFNSFAVAADDY